MPAYGVIDLPTGFEMNAIMPEVFISGAPLEYAWVDAIEHNSGIVPSKAILRLGANGYDVQGNVTLNAFDFSDLKPWTRVRISDGSEALFLGALMMRQDKGQENTIVWEAWGDIWQLSAIPVRGCLVWNEPQGRVNFISGYTNRVNPNAYRNCRISKVPGIAGLVPVFTYAAEAGAAYDDRDDDDSATEGAICHWTGLNYIKYLCALANITAGSVDGCNADSWISLAPSKRIVWRMGDTQLLSAADGSDSKPMCHKLPDHTFQGKSMLLALHEVLEMAPEYQVYGAIDSDADGNPLTAIKFYPKSNSSSDVQSVDLPLQRGGHADDIRTCFDFELSEDASEVRERAIGEGERVKVEFPIAMDWDDTAKEAIDNFLSRSWSADEADELTWIVNGGATPGAVDGQWAQYPTRLPDISSGETWRSMPHEPADGTGGSPRCGCNTPEALSLARTFVPRPWAALEVNSLASLLGSQPLSGFNQKFTDLSRYPCLQTPRPILPRQLQYYLDSKARAMRTHFPVRITVYDGTNKVDAVVCNGLDVDSDGTIWLHGLTDDLRVNQSDCIYTGSLVSGPQSVKLRQITINAAVPLDHRVQSVVALSQGQIDASMAKDMGGAMMLYCDCPTGFKEHHQVLSAPCAGKELPGSNGLVPMPISRILEDDSDTGSRRVQNHVKRRLTPASFVRRKSSWSMIGICSQYRVGVFIGQIAVRGQADDQNYLINAPIDRICYDFKDQVTRIGGLISECGKGQQSTRAFTRGAASVGGGKGGAPGGGFGLGQGRGGRTHVVAAGAGGFGAGAAGIFSGDPFAASQSALRGLMDGSQSAMGKVLGGSQQQLKGLMDGAQSTMKNVLQGSQSALQSGPPPAVQTGNSLYAAIAAAIGASKKMKPGDWGGKTNKM